MASPGWVRFEVIALTMGRRIGQFSGGSARDGAGLSLFARAGCWAVGCAVMAVVGLGGSIAFGQRGRVDSIRGPEVEVSPAVGHLLRTADEAINRADWKLAIDSLQRVIDAPAGLMPTERSDGQVIYESPRRVALARLASLPPEGLAAYRVLFDGRTKVLLREAQEAFDPEKLRDVIARYPMSSSAVRAAEVLSGWLLDLGQPFEAVGLLSWLDDVRGSAGGGGMDWRVEMKRALGLTMLGDAEGAAAALDRLREAASAEGNVDPGAVEAVGRAVAAMTGGGARRDGPLRSWTGFGGSGSRWGLMDPVLPSFAEKLPWRRKIPSLVGGVWPDLDGLGGHLLPVMQAVAADGRLFVKAGRECAAIDLQSFALLWTSEPLTIGISERRKAREDLGISLDRELLSDYVGGALSTSHGLVLSVERRVSESGFGADGVAVVNRGFRRPNRSRQKPPYNRLAAYDVRTGLLRWMRGGADDEAELFRGVMFMSAPVGVGDRLWVPFVHSGDLFLAALDPETGSPLQTVLLCTMGGVDLNPVLAMFPTAVDGVLYLPTGQGLLFAVNIRDGSVAWAHRYGDGIPLRARRRSAPASRVPQFWLSGPPIVVGREVLLAPTDGDDLMAFDRLTGSLLWTFPRGAHLYVVGTDGRMVWLGGGDAVSAVSLSDRTVVWRRAVQGATGRAALCGANVYVPTRRGLIGLDAASGEVVFDEPLPSDQPALGNLLSIGGSLVSVDTTEVRAFPDRHSYESTLAAHRADPSNARIAIRLAFMELLEGRARASLAVLEGIEVTDPVDGPLQRTHIAHLTVNALMEVAADPATPGAEAIRLLERAVSASLDRRDEVAAKLALGHRLHRMGRYAEAYRALWRLAQDPIADELVRRGSLRVPARLVIAETLLRIVPELAPTEVEQHVVEAMSVFEGARAGLADPSRRREAVRALVRLADSRTVGRVDRLALTALGRFEMGRGRYEPAEQYLVEALRRSGVWMGAAGATVDESGASTGGLTVGLSGDGFSGESDDGSAGAEAAIALMDLYLGRPGMAGQAVRLAEVLSRKWGEATVGGESVGALLAARRDRLAAAKASFGSGLAGGSGRVGAFRLGEVIESEDSEGLLGNVRLLYPKGPSVAAVADRVLTIEGPRVVRAHSIENGRSLWETELVSQTFALDGGESASVGGLTGGDRSFAWVDGLTVVMNGPDGLYGLGAVSGKRLWFREVRSRVILRDPVLRERLVDVAPGRLACVLAPGELTVLSLLDGSTVWAREIEGTPGTVRIVDGLVMVADARVERIEVYDLTDGSAFATLRFRQPEPESPSVVSAISVAYAAGVLCGPEGADVVGRDVRTGRVVWRLEGLGRVQSVFRLGGATGEVMIGQADGRHRVVDARSGAVSFDAVVEGFPGAAVFGARRGGLLLLAGLDESRAVDQWVVAGVEASSGRVGWTRRFRGLMPRSMLDAAEGVVPVVSYVELEEDGGGTAGGGSGARRRVVRRYVQRLSLLDSMTGQDVGESKIWDRTRMEELTGDMLVRPGRLVLQTHSGVVLVQTEAVGGGGSSVN